jgi:hypothetical protein
MDEEETTLYYGIILACIVGIAITSFLLLQSTPPEEEFSELYFYFERIDMVGGRGTFRGCTVEVSNTIWIDLNRNSTQDEEEIFLAGDTIIIDSEFWNISDVAKDSTQILFGKFPKEVSPGTINFSFVIVSHLQEDHLYEYVITVNDQEQKETILIKKEEKELIFQSIFIDSEGEFKVGITIDTGEEIYFYLYVRE